MSRCMSCDAVRSAPRQWRSRPTPRWGIASKVCLLRLTCRERVHPPTRSEGPFMVESRCGAVSVGRTYLFPPLSSGGALVVRPWLRFHIPLIEPDRRLYRIRLSDKTSRLHPRHVAPARGQAYEPEVPVKVREWISPAPTPPDFVLDAQPPAQPHGGVVVDRPICLGDGAYLEVVRPPTQRAIQLLHQLCGVLPCPVSDCQRVDGFHYALDALLRWPVPQARLAGSL